MNPWFLITLIGTPEIWLILSGIFLLSYLIMRDRMDAKTRKRIKKFCFVYVVGVWITVCLILGMKFAFNIERPCIPCGTEMMDCNPYCLSDNSFPSGHAAIIFAVFSSFYISLRRKWFTPLFIIPFLVAVSRYFLVVHYMVDVVFGTFIGTFVPIIVLIIYEKKF